MPDGLKAGELFVDLGIEGGAKTVGTLVSAKKGMGELASMSLEAKAGILAAMYGLERLVTTTAQFGNSLTNFKVLTGQNTSMVQQYMYAARQVGATNEDVTGSFKALQNSIAQVDINKGLPEGMKLISNTIKGFDFKKIHDLDYMMQQFQKFAQSGVPEGVKRWALGTVGMSEGMQAAMMQGAFNPGMMAKAPVYSEQQLKSLQQAGVAWGNLGNKIEMAFGKLNAKHSGKIIGDIDKIADSTLRLADNLLVLSERMGVFSKLGHSLEGVANIFKLVNELVDKAAGKDSKPGDLLHVEGEMFPGVKDSPVGRATSDLYDGLALGFSRMFRDMGISGGGGKVEVNQTITHVGDAKDTQAVKNIHKKAAQAERNHALRQSGANLQVN